MTTLIPIELEGIRRSRRDPVWFVRHVLTVDPWAKQEAVLRAVRDYRRTAVRSCHGIGKTRVAAWVALWFLLTHPDSLVVTTAPTWHQVEHLLWREIRAAHVLSAYPLGSKPLKTEYTLSEQWYALGLSTNEPERFQGFHAASGDILLICDEASGIEQTIFDAAEGFLTSDGARLLLIGNPTQLSGEFYTAFRSPLYHKIHISAFDSPNLRAGAVVRPYLITPAWVEEKRIKWGEDSPLWSARVLGEFPTQGDDTLISLAWVEAAQARYAETLPGAPVELGVDVARFGSDKSVLILRRGPRVTIYQVIAKSDLMALCGAVIHALGETGATMVKVDVIGVGAGVYDRCREQGKPVAPINVAEAPRDTERFANLRAELYWNLRELLRDGQMALPPDDDLAGQLASIKYKFDSRGRILIESKEDMRKRGLSSPDHADALALAFAPEPASSAVMVGGARTEVQTYRAR